MISKLHNDTKRMEKDSIIDVKLSNLTKFLQTQCRELKKSLSQTFFQAIDHKRIRIQVRQVVACITHKFFVLYGINQTPTMW